MSHLVPYNGTAQPEHLAAVHFCAILNEALRERGVHTLILSSISLRYAIRIAVRVIYGDRLLVTYHTHCKQRELTVNLEDTNPSALPAAERTANAIRATVRLTGELKYQ